LKRPLPGQAFSAWPARHRRIFYLDPSLGQQALGRTGPCPLPPITSSVRRGPGWLAFIPDADEKIGELERVVIALAIVLSAALDFRTRSSDFTYEAFKELMHDRSG
jgi:hypothetical protein